jgi:hypothetical protein
MSTPVSVIGVGSYVYVKKERRSGRANSEGGKAFVINAADADADDRCFDVRYILDKPLSPNIKVSRLRPATLGTTSRRGRGRELRLGVSKKLPRSRATTS